MKDFFELMEEAKKCPPKKLAVAVAQDKEVLEAVKACRENGIADAILVGDALEISRIAKEYDIDLNDLEVINETDQELAARRAVMLVNQGRADMVMKGQVPSPTVLKAVLDKEIGLRTGRGLSHVAVFESPGYERLMIMTDAGMNIMPNLEQKIDMVKNAVCVAKSLKIVKPKVAVIAGVELVNPDMPSTVDAAILSKMAERGQIKDCIIDGPLALDLALSKDSARAKGVSSPVAGQADILVLANIDAANVLYKALVFLGKAKITGLIVGAKAPVILTSRADTHEAKLASVAIGVLMTSKGDHPTKHRIPTKKLGAEGIKLVSGK